MGRKARQRQPLGMQGGKQVAEGHFRVQPVADIAAADLAAAIRFQQKPVEFGVPGLFLSCWVALGKPKASVVAASSQLLNPKSWSLSDR
jgi:hypothetical protein